MHFSIFSRIIFALVLSYEYTFHVRMIRILYLPGIYYHLPDCKKRTRTYVVLYIKWSRVHNPPWRDQVLEPRTEHGMNCTNPSVNISYVLFILKYQENNYIYGPTATWLLSTGAIGHDVSIAHWFIDLSLVSNVQQQYSKTKLLIVIVYSEVCVTPFFDSDDVSQKKEEKKKTTFCSAVFYS